MRVWITRGGEQAGVELSYDDMETYTRHSINLQDELGVSGGETIGLFRWAESAGYIRPS